MKGLRLLLLLAALLVALPASAQTTLYVNNSGSPACSDSTTKANNAAETPWCSIGRAAWGSTNRGSPNTSQAAAAGDTVEITGGTYTSTASVGDRFETLYLSANAGSSGSPITYKCMGVCTLIAESANSPIIGSSGRAYITWTVDDFTGGDRWVMQACGLTTAPTGCDANFVNITPDTGPLVCHDTVGCVIEGAQVDGGPPIDYSDNHNCIRIEQVTGFEVRNNYCENFSKASGTNHNQSGVTIYGGVGGVVEHNHFVGMGAGIYFKDTPAHQFQENNVVRYNLIEDVGEGIAYSLTGEGGNEVYQNIVLDSSYGVNVTGGAGVGTGGDGDDIFNNLFVVSTAAFQTNGSADNLRFWNNIAVLGTLALATNGVTWPSTHDNENNVYVGFGNFYQGTDGTLSLASFRSTYSQDLNSITSDPLFVNSAGGDYRLCTGAGTPEAGCVSASPAIALGVDALDLDGDSSTVDAIPAGPYITGSETIGTGGTEEVQTVPDAPTIGTATAGDASASVAFTPPVDDGGAAITGYTATSSPGGLTGNCSNSPCVVTGLTNGQAYTFTVTATNSVGTSSPSSASNSVTPLAPVTRPFRLRIVGENDE